MDKKKVKELVDELLSLIECTSGEYEDREILEEMEEKLKEVKEELSKSDWISVEERLPPFNKEVLVKTNDIFGVCYFTSSRDNALNKQYLVTYDKNDFQVADKRLYVTHWKPIEKLEGSS